MWEGKEKKKKEREIREKKQNNDYYYSSFASLSSSADAPNLEPYQGNTLLMHDPQKIYALCHPDQIIHSIPTRSLFPLFLPRSHII